MIERKQKICHSERSKGVNHNLLITNMICGLGFFVKKCFRIIVNEVFAQSLNSVIMPDALSERLTP